MSDRDTFDRLLEALPKIAESVNSFDSEEVQQAAFSALISSLSIDTVSRPHAHVEDAVPALVEDEAQALAGDETPAARSAKDSTTRRRNKRTTAKKNFAPVKDINFAPEGKESLETFVAKKLPKNQYEKNLIACYYLNEHLELTDITVGHVLAVYKACDWTSPGNPENSLQATASTKHWLDTSDMSKIKLVWAGTNYVEKMPIEPKGAGKS